MKYLLIIFIGLSFCFGCHKKKDNPAPVVIYTDSLAGNYLGHETVYQNAQGGSPSYDNGSKTIKINIVGTNRIQISGFYEGNPFFDVTGIDGSGRKIITIESSNGTFEGMGENYYDPSTKSLFICFKSYYKINNITYYDYTIYTATKQ
jgi:hypothetical protein